MFGIAQLRELASEAGHAIDGEVHKFLTYLEDMIAAVTPHVSFGRPDPKQPTVAPAQVVVTRADVLAPPVQAVEAAPVEAAPVEAAPVEAAPVEAAPVEAPAP